MSSVSAGGNAPSDIPLPETAAGRAPGRARLAGRRILVIGGGQDDRRVEEPPIGNGRAMSVLFAREGAAVAVADIDRARAEATAELVQAEGTAATVLVGDASVEDDVTDLFAGASGAMGGLDGVVLNAGIGAGLGLRGTTSAQWDHVMAVNARSQFLGCRQALQTMSGGAVVLVGSVAARETMAVPAYGASKAALESLCRQAAIEGAPRLRFNLVEPGLIDTPLGRRASGATPGRAHVRIPARRQGTAWEVAYAALYLLSEESSYVTGQVLVVDGGLTIGFRA